MEKADMYKILKESPLLNPYYEESYCCNKLEVKPMFENINNMAECIKELKKYYNVSYYDNLYNRTVNKINNILNIIDFDNDLDDILLQFVKCRPNMKIVISSKAKYNIPNIIATKKICINSKQMLGFLYQISIYKELQTIDSLTKMRNDLMKNREMYIYITFYEEESIKEPVILPDTIYSTNNFIETIEVAMLCCCKNSFRLLQYQRLDRLLYGNYAHSRTLLMTYKKWLYMNIPLIDHNRFMVFSGSVLYTMGIRNLSDIDLIMYADKFNNDDLLNKFFINPETRFPFVDFHHKIGNDWFHLGKHMDYLSEWFDKEWPALYKASSMVETIFNPKFHFYYLGVKVQSMEADIQRRIKRCRPAAYADLIAIIKFTSQKIDIPKLDKGYWKDHQYYDFDQKEIYKLVNTTQWHLKKKYHVIMDIDTIKEFIGIEKN